ncbi:transglutaminase family protein, partial [Nanoarchaeota archaeon]
MDSAETGVNKDFRQLDLDQRECQDRAQIESLPEPDEMTTLASVGNLGVFNGDSLQETGLDDLLYGFRFADPEIEQVRLDTAEDELFGRLFKMGVSGHDDDFWEVREQLRAVEKDREELLNQELEEKYGFRVRFDGDSVAFDGMQLTREEFLPVLKENNGGEISAVADIVDYHYQCQADSWAQLLKKEEERQLQVPLMPGEEATFRTEILEGLQSEFQTYDDYLDQLDLAGNGPIYLTESWFKKKLRRGAGIAALVMMSLLPVQTANMACSDTTPKPLTPIGLKVVKPRLDQTRQILMDIYKKGLGPEKAFEAYKRELDNRLDPLPTGYKKHTKGEKKRSRREKIRKLLAEEPEQLVTPTPPSKNKEKIKLDKDSEKKILATYTRGGTLYWKQNDADTYDGKGWTKVGRDTTLESVLQNHNIQDNLVNFKSEVFSPQDFMYVATEYGSLTVKGELSEESKARYTKKINPDDRKDKDLDALILKTLKDKYSLHATSMSALKGKLGEYRAPTEIARATQYAINKLHKYVAYDEQLNQEYEEADDILKVFDRRKAGDCQMFATKLIAKLRQVGIPARYVSGYASSGGKLTTPGHAWVEAWVGDGWKIFDSTGSLIQDSKKPSKTEAEKIEQSKQFYDNLVQKAKTLQPEEFRKHLKKAYSLWWEARNMSLKRDFYNHMLLTIDKATDQKSRVAAAIATRLCLGNYGRSGNLLENLVDDAVKTDDPFRSLHMLMNQGGRSSSDSPFYEIEVLKRLIQSGKKPPAKLTKIMLDQFHNRVFRQKKGIYSPASISYVNPQEYLDDIIESMPQLERQRYVIQLTQ